MIIMNKLKTISVLIFILLLFPSIIAQPPETILASEKIELDNNKNLIEWFSSTECVKCRQFGNQNLDSSYIWINWFDSKSDPVDNLARKDAENRLNQVNVTNLPLLLVDGKVLQLDNDENISNWNQILFNETSRESKSKKLNFSLKIDLIDSTGNNLVDSIKLTGNITPLSDLHNTTEIQIHLVQKRDDPDGSGARPYISNVLKEWVPRMDFSVEKGNSTGWDYTLTETHLKSAGIELTTGDSNRYSIIISVHGEERQNASLMNVLAVNSIDLPSLNENKKWEELPIIMLANLVILVGLMFIVLQERTREKGLPLIQGKIIFMKKEERKIDLNIVTGNKKVEIINIEISKGWRTSKIGKLPTIASHSSHNLQFKIHSKQSVNEIPIQLTVKTDIEDLGQWMMDIEMVNEQTNNKID